MNRSGILVAGLMVATQPLAHDTTHIHPLITEKVIELIENRDEAGSYQELYLAVPDPDNSNRRLYPHWGNDWDTANPPAEIDIVMNVDLYGLYADAARSAAMFHFGMALHHVEDMSSPAHVHNDPHLMFLAIES
ncbi:MAG: hypothetical protein LC637_09975 [Xanthomonadaceae bacterium]|nr:hypothetical protein [Xanthomonadaceae bacterium]